MCFWWIAGRQQQGRAILTITGLPALPVLDVRALDTTQLAIAERIFEEFQDWTFLPANEAYRDDTRKALDRAVLCELLGLPESILEPLGVLREQWCAEPDRARWQVDEAHRWAVSGTTTLSGGAQ